MLTTTGPRRPGDASIGVGHVHAAVFVPHADIGDVGGVVERIVDFERARAHQPEDGGHADHTQCFHGCDTAPHYGHSSLPMCLSPWLYLHSSEVRAYEWSVLACLGCETGEHCAFGR